MRYTGFSKFGNPASGSNVPPKAGPAAKAHGDPLGCVSGPKAKASGEIIGQSSRNRVQDNTAKTVGIATIVGSGTHSALFHGGVSGHAAGVPTALCRSSNGPGHGKLGHEICKQNSPGRSSDSLNPTARPRCPAHHQPTASEPPNRQPPSPPLKRSITQWQPQPTPGPKPAGSAAAAIAGSPPAVRPGRRQLRNRRRRLSAPPAPGRRLCCSRHSGASRNPVASPGLRPAPAQRPAGPASAKQRRPFAGQRFGSFYFRNKPSSPHPNRHSRTPTVTPAPQPSLPHPNRHSRTPTVTPTSQPSFRRKPESKGASGLRLSPERRPASPTT